MSGVHVYVPCDSAARSVGADAVAAALAAVDGVRVVRTGSRGMLWCEPMVEVEVGGTRVAYGPVAPQQAPEVVAAALRGTDHPRCLGPVDGIGWLARQQRYTCGRLGVVDPLDLDDYTVHEGYDGLRAALAMTPAQVVAAVTDSGLRGRGGAGFPTGVKWRTVLDAPAGARHICANADEGDSGTFADRMLMEGDPFSLIEGMTIAAHAVGGDAEGYVYIRSEYPDAVRTMGAAVATARRAGLLGRDILGSGLHFDIHVRVGAGAYICGEETAMLDSLEGLRGQVRAKPPVPAVAGLFGRPTVVNNVLTLCTVPPILARGAAGYAAMGMDRSRGTQVFQLGGDIRHGGLVETAFGVTLHELVHGFGGGTRGGRPVGAVQVGGPLGAYLPATDMDVAMDYEALTARGGLLGHGGVVVFDDTVDMARQARWAMAFCAHESCGKCTPCRVGSVRGVEVLDDIIAGRDREANLALLEDLCDTMEGASLCAMGGLTPLPVRSAVRHFPHHFDREGPR